MANLRTPSSTFRAEVLNFFRWMCGERFLNRVQEDGGGVARLHRKDCKCDWQSMMSNPVEDPIKVSFTAARGAQA